MTDMHESAEQQQVSAPQPPGAQQATGWVAWILFAGVMMIMLGVFHATVGLVALLKDDYYAVDQDGLALSVDYTAWGWVHLVAGVVVGLAGLAVMVGKTWARVVGVVVAFVSALVNIGFLAARPVWSAIIIAIDVLVIYALTVHGREVRALDL